MIIVLSGTDGAGKSTQIGMLTDFLGRDRVRVIWARGGYTPIFKFIKRVIKSVGIGNNKASLSSSRHIGTPGARDQLFSSSIFCRLWLAVSIIDLILYFGVYTRYLRVRGFTVICDRCYVDTHVDFLLRFPEVFSSSGILWRLFIYLNPKPDIAFFCYVDPECSVERARQKNDPYPDSLEHLKERYDCYFSLIPLNDPLWRYVDCMQSVSEVHKEIKNVVSGGVR